ncbi:MAG: hypothetical protein H6575_14205 [Lewinellaceae bacterium]|nr:hypothetical protein [Saprospiraceae bacterium]MCB9355716.1 hypothetical protein [Lewinellaceae bacterium]
MLESPLIRTLQLLEPEEFDALHSFVVSPVFNDSARSNDAIRLYEQIRGHYPAFDHESLQKEIIGQELFPDRNNPAGEVEKAMSELMHVLKQFINYSCFTVQGGKAVRRSSKKDFAENPGMLLNFARQQLAMMRFYSDRLPRHLANGNTRQALPGKRQKVKRAENYFQNLYSELREVMASQKRFDHFKEHEFREFHYLRFLTEQEKLLHDQLENKLNVDFNLLGPLEELDRFYLFTKLELTSMLVHYLRVVKPFDEDSDEFHRLSSNKEITLLILQLLRERGYWQDSPGVNLYSTLLEFLAGEEGEVSDKVSDRFAEMVYKHQQTLPRDRLWDFNVLLRSYWNRRYRLTKNPEFMGRLHGMHLEQLRFFSSDTPLPELHVFNMLSTALKLKKTIWAEQFLREYVGTLREGGAQPPAPHKYPPYTVRIWWAMLYLTKEEYQKADEVMPRYDKYSSLDDIYMFSIVAAADIKIDYELDILDDNLVRAATARIERYKDIPKERRDERLNFFKAARRLNTLRGRLGFKAPAGILKDLEALLESINEHPAVEWEWLEEKIADLKTQLQDRMK